MAEKERCPACRGTGRKKCEHGKHYPHDKAGGDKCGGGPTCSACGGLGHR